MVIRRNFIFFCTIRVIFDDAMLRRVLDERRYSYITGLSYDGAFSGNGVSRKAKKTVVVNLQKAEEETFRAFNDTSRNEIRRTESMHEFRFAVPDSARDAIWRLYRDFESRSSRPVRAQRYFRHHLFMGAYYNDTLVAAIILYDSHPILRVNAIVARDKESFPERKYVGYATRRLIWEACKYGMLHGYELLDLGGINLTEKTKAGITAFKMSFGGELMEEYTYTYKSPVFNFLRKLKL